MLVVRRQLSSDTCSLAVSHPNAVVDVNIQTVQPSTLAVRRVRHRLFGHKTARMTLTLRTLASNLARRALAGKLRHFDHNLHLLISIRTHQPPIGWWQLDVGLGHEHFAPVSVPDEPGPPVLRLLIPDGSGRPILGTE